MRKQTIAALAALVLVVGLASPSSAASVVDVSYDVSQTTFLNSFLPDCSQTPLTELCVSSQLISGNMKIRYTSDSASSMPLLSGPATLQSLSLNGTIEFAFANYPSATTHYTITRAKFNMVLVSPVSGNLSGGALALGSAQFQVTGTRHCTGANFYATGLCVAFAATLTSVVGPLGPYTSTATMNFATGYVGATRHTVSGSVSATVPAKWPAANNMFATGVNIIGREILREAEGHDPKVIPEPGTMLLLGTGTAGLALVGRATRRSKSKSR